MLKRRIVKGVIRKGWGLRGWKRKLSRALYINERLASGKRVRTPVDDNGSPIGGEVFATKEAALRALLRGKLGMLREAKKTLADNARTVRRLERAVVLLQDKLL